MKEIVFDWTNHKRLWNLLAEIGTIDKMYALHLLNLPIKELPDIVYNCFACDYVLKYEEDSCENCPFGNQSEEPCLYGLFDLWIESRSVEERKVYAKMIANLPIRTDVEVLTK
jgi:hypothetical protein